MPPSAGFGSRATTTWSLARSDCGERFENWVHEASGQDEERTNELRTALAERWYAHVRLPPVLLDEESRRSWVEEMDFDPRPVFAHVRAPMLLFYGEADSWDRRRAECRSVA